jgi:hypothetical protein
VRAGAVGFAGTAVRAVAAIAMSAASCHRTPLPPRPDGAAVVVAVEPPAEETGVAFIPETEPNDTPQTAQTLTVNPGAPVGVRATIQGGVVGQTGAVAKRDVDCYRLILQGPDPGAAPAADAGLRDGGPPPPRASLRLDLLPDPGARLELAIIDARGAVVTTVTPAGAGEPIAIPNLAFMGVPIVVRVKAFGTAPLAAAAYHLIVRAAPFEPGSEVEPNDRAPLATPLDPAGEAVGYLGWRNDQDWYRIGTGGLAEGSVLSADLDAIPEVAVALQVYDSGDHKLFEVRARKGDRASLRNVRVPSGAPDIYLVVRAIGAGDPSVRYDLRPRFELLKSGSEVEPNDDAEHAQWISGALVGYLGRGDVDTFRTTTDGPAELDVVLEPADRSAVRIDVLREDGALLARADSQRRGATRIAQPVPGGPVLIRLSNGRGGVNPDDPYKLTVTVIPGGGAPSAQPVTP